jgi:hypothetical protein
MRRFFIPLSLLICVILHSPVRSFSQAASIGSSFLNMSLSAPESQVVSAMDVALGAKSGMITSLKLQAFASSLLSHNDLGNTVSFLNERRQIQPSNKPALSEENSMKTINQFEVIRILFLKALLHAYIFI